MPGYHTPTIPGVPEYPYEGAALTPAQQVAAAAVGYHDAIDLVQAKCPPGWRAISVWGIAHPVARPGMLRVGQVRCVHGDPDYPLYIYPTNPEATPEAGHNPGQA